MVMFVHTAKLFLFKKRTWMFKKKKTPHLAKTWRSDVQIQSLLASLVGDQAAETGQGYASSEETTKGFAAVEAHHTLKDTTYAFYGGDQSRLLNVYVRMYKKTHVFVYPYVCGFDFIVMLVLF